MFPQLLNALKENKLFDKVKESDLNFHVSLDCLWDKKAGEIIYKEGDQGNCVFVILEGEVAVDKPFQLGNPTKQIVRAKDFFGEEDYLEHMPRTSTAYVLSDSSTIVKLEKSILDTLCRNNGQVLANLRRIPLEESIPFEAASAEGFAEDGFNTDPFSEKLFNENQDFIFDDTTLKADQFPAAEVNQKDTFNFGEKMDTEKPGFEDDFNIDNIPDFSFTGKQDDDTKAIEEHIPIEQVPYGNELSTDQLKLIMQAAQLVNSNIKIDDLLEAIVDAARNLTSAERGTLYLVDREKDELWSKIAEGEGITEIRLKIGEGVAGWAAENREIVNIKDVKHDPRFKNSYDHKTGFITKTMICFPINNKTDEVVGVLQLLNSGRGEFNKQDEQFLTMLSVHAALALENAGLVERLLQTERVTSLGKMANFLIQDIKKPVLVSKRYAEHLKTKNLTPDVTQVLDMLLEQLNHLADVVQTTSSYSEGKTILRSVICKINETLDAVFEKLESNVRIRNCEIIKQYDKDANVKIDRKEFYQCCMHIIRNACDAMTDGGKVFVTTKNKKSHVEITFKDTGLGIPDSIKDKIFEPFMTHGKSEGTGLGLSITKKIIEDHGGTISVESDLGEGATFTITIPTAQV